MFPSVEIISGDRAGNTFTGHMHTPFLMYCLKLCAVDCKLLDKD